MLKILYHDQEIAVCCKPAGIASQETPDGNNMITMLAGELKTEVFPVHRLDRETSGVMVYALNRKSAAALSEAVQSEGFAKEYLAVLRDVPAAESGVYEDLLYHDTAKNKSFVVKRMRRGVREASLDYQVMAKAENMSLVIIRLHTGRTHQIRVQFATRKTPVAGDGKYGGSTDCPLALCAYRLTLSHPVTGERMEFTADLPKEYPWNLFSLSES